MRSLLAAAGLAEALFEDPWLSALGYVLLALIAIYSVAGAVYWCFARKPSATAILLTGLPLLIMLFLMLWPR